MRSRYAGFALCTLVLLVGYGATALFLGGGGGMGMGSGAHELPRLPLERRMPVFAETVVVYLAALPSVFLTFLYTRDAAALRRLTRAITGCILLAECCFALLPTMVPRDRVVQGAAWAVDLLRGLYAIDPPRNGCPSLHVAVNALCALHVARTVRRPGAAIRSLCAAWVLVVWASTVLTGQHALVDGACGLVLGVLSYELAPVRLRRRAGASQRPQHAG